MQTRKIPKLVLTGGPCAGKTTAIAYLGEKLGDLGYYPFIVPETPTLLMGSRVTPVGGFFPPQEFQDDVLRLQLFFNRFFEEKAERVNHPKPVLLYDRGLMDQQPYISSPEVFERMLAGHGLSVVDARDKSYDAVFHLRSAALGAPEFYGSATNKVRRETLEEARHMDESTLAAWIGHPHLKDIANERFISGERTQITFDQKLKNLLVECCHALGIPEPLEIERKFIVEPVKLPLPVPHQDIEIEQFYLATRGKERELRYRKRGQYGHFVYFETEKRTLRRGVRVETERFITKSEYEAGKALKAPGSVVIHKRRICFVYEHRYFELDFFLSPEGIPPTLEIELTNENEEVEMPPFIRVVKEVTHEDGYGNHSIAFGKYKK